MYAPSDLTVAVSGVTAVLHWLNGGSYGNVFVYRKLGAGSWTKIASLSGGTTTYTDQPPGSGTYTYGVSGYTAETKLWDPETRTWEITPAEETDKAESDPVTFSPPTAPSTPTMGALVSSSNPLGVTIPCSGGGVGTTGYRVERAPNSGGSPGTYTEIGTIDYTGSIVNFHDGTVSVGTTYWYHIRAYNAYGNSSYASAASVAVPATGIPGTPSITLEALDGGFRCTIAPGEDGTYPRAGFELAWSIDPIA